MKVLWFSPTPSLYTDKLWGHNGAGWISSLQSIVGEIDTIRLGVAFEYTSETFSETIDEVTYYPMSSPSGIIHKLCKRSQLELLIEGALAVIADFQPDVIQLFGSESWYGLIAEYTDIPVVIHMQGSLPSYYNARYPVGMSVWDKLVSRKTSIKQKLMAFRIDATFRKNALQEERILKHNHYFMGRTHWDKAIVELYNPDAHYFTVQEALRDGFHGSPYKWTYISRPKHQLISVISGPLYKGLDLVLKTARMLKEHTSFDFEWQVCGLSKADFIEDVYGIECREVNVKLLGVLSQDALIDQLTSSSLYIHPSYIDNSPNSICEAQLLGMPIIATDVGGVSSIVSHGIDGLLVPANDPLMMTSLIMTSCNDETLLTQFSHKARENAEHRHAPEHIKEALFEVYKDIINNK